MRGRECGTLRFFLGIGLFFLAGSASSLLAQEEVDTGDTELERVRKKLDSIVIPKIDFKEATPAEAFEFLRKAAWENDTTEKDAHRRGVPIIYLPRELSDFEKEFDGAGEPMTVTLELEDCPLGVALIYTAESIGCWPAVTELGMVVADIWTYHEYSQQSDQEARALRKRLQEIVIPEIDFTDTTLEEAVDFLQQASKRVDGFGINLVLGPGTEDSALINMTLRDIPIGEALKFICELSGTHQYGVRGYAVVVAASDSRLLERPPYIRSFPVPHDFFNLVDQLRAKHDPSVKPGDSARDGLLKVLQNIGVETVVDGSQHRAVLLEKEHHLIARNTVENLDLIAGFVETIWRLVPTPVDLRVEIFMLPKETARQVIESNPDQHSLRIELGKLVDASDSIRAVCLSGEPVTAGSGIEIELVTSYAVEDGKEQPVRQKTLVGTQLQAIATYPDDGTGILLEIDLSKSFGEPEIVDSTVRSALSGELLPVQNLRVKVGSIKTKIRLDSGAAQLLGAINEPGEEGKVGVVVVRATAGKPGK